MKRASISPLVISALAMLISVAPSAARQPTPDRNVSVFRDDPSVYIDDRSSSASLLRSYYNAVARKQYLRAFNYLDHGGETPTAEDLKKFADGYTHTVSFRLKIGKENGDGGAGSVVYCLPVALEATLDNGRKQVFSGYYRFLYISADNQIMPPFRPMTITKGDLHLSQKPFEKSVPASCDTGT